MVILSFVVIAAPRALASVMSSRLLDLENHFPCTTETVEGPFEPILDEIPREMLEANRCSERAIFPNSPVNVLCLALERSTACHNLSKDGQRNGGWLAWTSRRGRRATPFAVIWTSSTSIAELRQ